MPRRILPSDIQSKVFSTVLIMFEGGLTLAISPRNDVAVPTSAFFLPYFLHQETCYHLLPVTFPWRSCAINAHVFQGHAVKPTTCRDPETARLFPEGVLPTYQQGRPLSTKTEVQKTDCVTRTNDLRTQTSTFINAFQTFQRLRQCCHRILKVFFPQSLNGFEVFLEWSFLRAGSQNLSSLSLAAFIVQKVFCLSTVTKLFDPD